MLRIMWNKLSLLPFTQAAYLDSALLLALPVFLNQNIRTSSFDVVLVSQLVEHLDAMVLYFTLG